MNVNSQTPHNKEAGVLLVASSNIDWRNWLGQTMEEVSQETGTKHEFLRTEEGIRDRLAATDKPPILRILGTEFIRGYSDSFEGMPVYSPPLFESITEERGIPTTIILHRATAQDLIPALS